MRIAIAGGHGKIGLRLIALLSARGYEVFSIDRNPAYGDELRQAGAEPVVCDLESADADDVAAALGSVDAVVFTAGAGPGSGPERKWSMDHGGAVKLIAAAHANGVARYVMVSARGADPQADDDGGFGTYLRAKGMAEVELRDSDLEATIIRPVGLTDDPGSGRVEIAERPASESISRDDVAAVIAAVLEREPAITKTFTVASGDRQIEDAVASL